MQLVSLCQRAVHVEPLPRVSRHP